MLKSIRNRLILLYTFSTGFILTTVLVLVLIMTQKQLESSQRDTFWNNYITISQKVEMDSEISNLWLSELELKNHLIIQIEENGIPFLFHGAWQTPTDRQTLINKTKELAIEDNIDTNLRPISMSEVKSEIYSVGGRNKDRYLGEVIIIPTKPGYRSVVILQYLSDKTAAAVKQKLFIAFLEFAGIAMLFLVSRYMVGKSLIPVEESRKRQTEFIAAASHELKSPLAVIRASSSAILLEPEKAEYFAKITDKECKRLSDLIEDMLLLANVDAKQWRVKKELIDMDILLIDTYDTFVPFCKERKKQLKLELQEKMLPIVEGDALRIKQVLAVLLDNAVSYSKEEDMIMIRAFVKKNNLWIEVEDHGVGIEQFKKKEVFERFYREDKSRKDKNHYGLGLSIAKELVELHDGSISCKDTLGGGATFAFNLPIHK
jgi:two-component system, OmpR family, manganese sensing sensor histidine kinase